MSTRNTPSPNSPSGAPKPGASTYWMYGLHACLAALANKDRRIRRLVVSEAAEASLPKPLKLPVERRTGKEIASLVGTDAVHQGIALLTDRLLQPGFEEILRGARPILILDQVSDPHNVGAILRSAAAFDAAAVVLPKDHAPPESAIIAKTASGALECVPLVHVTNLAAALDTAKKAGFWVAGLAGEAKQTLAEAKLGQKTLLVLGAEGPGMRRLTRERCDLLVRLPISPRMESLNVSNAAAVALYQLHIGQA